MTDNNPVRPIESKTFAEAAAALSERFCPAFPFSHGQVNEFGHCPECGGYWHRHGNGPDISLSATLTSRTQGGFIIGSAYTPLAIRDDSPEWFDMRRAFAALRGMR